MDHIGIRDLRIQAKHGCSEFEKEHEQEFVVNIEAVLDTKAAAASDALVDTVDYTFFRETALQVFASPPKNLIESLAEEIATALLQERRLQSVSVSILKTEIFTDCQSWVTIERRQG